MWLKSASASLKVVLPKLKYFSGISTVVKYKTKSLRICVSNFFGKELVSNQHSFSSLSAKLPTAEVTKRMAKENKAMAQWHIICNDTEHLI